MNDIPSIEWSKLDLSELDASIICRASTTRMSREMIDYRATNYRCSQLWPYSIEGMSCIKSIDL